MTSVYYFLFAFCTFDSTLRGEVILRQRQWSIFPKPECWFGLRYDLQCTIMAADSRTFYASRWLLSHINFHQKSSRRTKSVFYLSCLSCLFYCTEGPNYRQRPRSIFSKEGQPLICRLDLWIVLSYNYLTLLCGNHVYQIENFIICGLHIFSMPYQSIFCTYSLNSRAKLIIRTWHSFRSEFWMFGLSVTM